MTTINKISFEELEKNKNWIEAVIVFTSGSFDFPYNEIERSYEINSGEKYFNADMNGNSLYGDCLDGNDLGVRLDRYMYEGWNPDFCYITEYKEEGAHRNEEGSN